MARKLRGISESILLSVALAGGGTSAATAQQATDAEASTVVVTGESAGEVRSGGRATASAPGPVIDYVAQDSRAGTKTDTPLLETPQSITVVGDQQMRDQGVQNLQEAVRYVPGVLADGFGYDTRNDYAIIRGVPASYFIDGLRSSFGYYMSGPPSSPTPWSGWRFCAVPRPCSTGRHP